MQSNKSGNKSESSFVVKSLRNLVLVLLFIVFISIMYNFQNKGVTTETALLSDAIFSEEIQGVFIREETPVTYSGKGVLSYKVEDGGKVGKKEVIADVYPNDEQITRNREIAKLERELAILEKIQNPGTLESAQPAGLSVNISESYRSLLYSRDMKDYDTLRDEMENLVVGMSTYQIITQQVTGFNQQIIDINANLAELKALPEGALKEPQHAAALTVAALCMYPVDKEASFEMLNYLHGPRGLSVSDKQFIQDRFRDKDYVPRSYFVGATPDNNYEPISLKFKQKRKNLQN